MSCTTSGYRPTVIMVRDSVRLVQPCSVASRQGARLAGFIDSSKGARLADVLYDLGSKSVDGDGLGYEHSRCQPLRAANSCKIAEFGPYRLVTRDTSLSVT